MIIDSSALVAILAREQERTEFEALVARDPFPRISAATYLETGIVVDSPRNPILSRELDRYLASADITIEPVTTEQAIMARYAYRDFGKGSGHAAQLNFGDCFAYALAKAYDEPLLFKGDNFGHTDVRPAVPQQP